MILSSESNLKLIIINMLEKKENMTVDEYELYLSLTVPNEIKEINKNKDIEIKVEEMSIPIQPVKQYPALPDSEDEES